MSYYRFCIIFISMVGLLVAGCQSSSPLLRKQARDALHDGQLDVAYERLDRAVSQKPTDSKAIYLLGKVLLERGQPLDAQYALEKALALNPDGPETPQILDDLAEAIFRQDKYDLLAARLQDATKQYGKTKEFRRQGDYLARMGDVDGAVLAYRKAARFAKDDPSANLALADLYESIGDRQRALEQLYLAYQVEPGNPRINHRLRTYGLIPGPTMNISHP